MRRHLTAALALLLVAGCTMPDEVSSGRSTPGALVSHVMTGKVTAPASLVSNNAASLISNNSSNVVSNNTAGYHVAAVQELPVYRAKVLLERADGTVAATTETNEQGLYTLPVAELNKTYLVKATFTLESGSYQVLTLAKPTTSTTEAPVTTASTLVSAKILASAGQTAIEKVELEKFRGLIVTVGELQTDASPAALGSVEAGAQAMDAIAEGSTGLAGDLAEVLAAADSFSGGME